MADESHLLYQGIPAHRYWREHDRKERRRKIRAVGIAAGAVGLLLVIAAAVWVRSL